MAIWASESFALVDILPEGVGLSSTMRSIISFTRAVGEGVGQTLGERQRSPKLCFGSAAKRPERQGLRPWTPRLHASRRRGCRPKCWASVSEAQDVTRAAGEGVGQ